MELYPHQISALEFIQKNKKVIIPLAPGLGKTRIALMHAKNKKTLIIVPSFLKLNWKKEIDMFPSDSFKKEIRIISYHEVVRDCDLLLSEAFEYIVLDEAHFIKNVNAKRTLSCVKIIRKNLSSDVALLTGTPIKNRINELWSLLFCVASTNFPFTQTYPSFCNEFSNLKIQYFGSKKVVSYVGVRNVEKLNRLIHPIYFYADQEKLLKLPEKIIKTVDLNLDSDQLLEGVDLDKQDYFSTQKRQNAITKAEKSVDYIIDLVDQVEKLVIFSDHPDAAKYIYNYFKDKRNCFLITGETYTQDRQYYVDMFNKYSSAVIVCTIGAASVGLNLQTANHCVFIDYPWVPGDLEQAEKRIRRIGQTKTCFYHYLISGKIDEIILKSVQSKMDVIKEVNESF